MFYHVLFLPLFYFKWLSVLYSDGPQMPQCMRDVLFLDFNFDQSFIKYCIIFNEFNDCELFGILTCFI